MHSGGMPHTNGHEAVIIRLNELWKIRKKKHEIKKGLWDKIWEELEGKMVSENDQNILYACMRFSNNK